MGGVIASPVHPSQSDPCFAMQGLQALTSDLSSKTNALADAEERFLQLEGLMQRIVARNPSSGFPGGMALI